MDRSQPNKEELFRMGKQAVKNGQRQPARMMFQQIIDQDPDNVRAMLWLAKLTKDPEERTEWLERVLDVDPENKTALKVLGRLEKSEDAERNKMLLRAGAIAYVILLPIIAVTIVIPLFS